VRPATNHSRPLRATAGDSSPSYDEQSGTYTYVWKTSSSWAGNCRRFTVALDDGSRYAADFFFQP
jgi:hypothetical protein